MTLAQTVLTLAFASLLASPAATAKYLQQGPGLVGSGADFLTLQGESVSTSSDGNTVIVGGHGANTYAGAAWVFTRSDSTWTQQGPQLVGIGAVGSASQVS